MWDDFTNLYSLSKTLRFELKPTDATKAFLAKSGIVDVDRKRQEAFKQVKLILDVVHRQFISESLAGLDLDTAELHKFITVSTDKLVKRVETATAGKPIFARFADQFSETNKSWVNRFLLKKPFTTSPDSQLAVANATAPLIAKQLNLSEETVRQQLAQFTRFSTYFKGFQENRLNCYTTDGKNTEVANRAITQNLLKYHKNIEKYCKFYANSDSPLCLTDLERPYFDLVNYQRYLTQSDIDKYNCAIGELNSRINEARQILSKEFKTKLPMFESLYKQILSESTKLVRFQKLANQDEYQDLVKQLQADIPTWLVRIREHFNDHIQTISTPDKVYLSKKAVNTILHKYVMDISLVTSELPPEFTKRHTRGDAVVDSANFVSLEQFFIAIDRAQDAAELSILKDNGSVSTHASRVVWDKFISDLQESINTAEATSKAFATITDSQDKSCLETIKVALDSFNDTCRLYSYFELRYKNEAVTSLEADPEFYAIFEPSTETDSPFDPDKDSRFSHSYDLIRNWLTKKPYSLDKWKLNFDCSQLMTGWDVNKEPEKHGVILRHDERYYLAVIDSNTSSVFRKDKNSKLFRADDSGWEKMEYKLLPGPNKMLPKCLLPKKEPGKYGATEAIIDLYSTGQFKKGENFQLNKLYALIDFYKQAMTRYEGWSMFDFSFRETTGYESIDQFYHDVEKGGYKLDFVAINYAELSALEQNGSVYLFEITNKDLANSNPKRQNLHSLYFRQLFESGTNLKLNGEAEIFYRPQSLDKKVSKLHLTPQGTEVIEHERFTADKFQLHMPLTLNRTTKSLVNASFNQHAIERIKTNQVSAVIGIDRGEKHLAYVAVVDRKGKLITEPISLNTITSTKPDGNTITTDYFGLLKEQETKRKEDRQNWEAVRKIKDLKDGYVGHCVKQIVDLAVKYNAVIVLEDLNRGFKQGRSAIERSVYDHLEQALLKKLQYVVDKSAKPDAVFGSRNGVQLAPPDISPKATNSHMGIVFFVDPSYTSAVDPMTGYRQQFRLDERINTSNFQKFIVEGFDSITYENSNLIFRFNWRQLADARNKIGKSYLTAKEGGKISSKSWQITANVERTVYKKQKSGVNETIPVNPQAELLKLLSAADIKMGGDIKKQLAATKPTAEFVKKFIWCFNTINKLRNTVNEQDAIISPIYPGGFNSLTATLDGYGWNGDANGAYNIARKGVILLDKLYAAKTPKDFKCSVSIAEYDAALTSK